MNDKLTYVAMKAGMDREVIDRLYQLLVNPKDRAYVMCNTPDCRKKVKGECMIYAVLDESPVKLSQRRIQES
jgi:hypothetical protein